MTIVIKQAKKVPRLIGDVELLPKHAAVIKTALCVCGHACAQHYINGDHACSECTCALYFAQEHFDKEQRRLDAERQRKARAAHHAKQYEVCTCGCVRSLHYGTSQGGRCKRCYRCTNFHKQDDA